MLFFSPLLLIPTVCLLSRWTSLITGNIRPCERVVLFPTIASQVPQKSSSLTFEKDEDEGIQQQQQQQQEWLVPIHGWVFTTKRHQKRRRAFLSLLRRTLKIERQYKGMFEQRLTPFIVDNKRWKSIRVQIGNEIHVLPNRSTKNGHFRGILRLSLNETATDVLKYHALLDDPDTPYCCNDGRVIPGEVHLLPPTGLSIISDIDDTIKISNVTSTKALLRNTFLEEFKAVPGMADIYQQMYHNLNASIHFVSSSPWQLYEDLQDFTITSGFPPSTFDLKSVRVKDRTLLNLMACPIQTKTAIIEGTLTRFPQRHFILVGDSGEKDAEVYGGIAQRYPEQISHILIRNMNGNKTLLPRMEEAFEGIPKSKWTLFEDISEIPTNLYKGGDGGVTRTTRNNKMNGFALSSV